MEANRSASEVLEDLITTVCGDSTIVRPLLLVSSPTKRRRGSSGCSTSPSSKHSVNRFHSDISVDSSSSSTRFSAEKKFIKREMSSDSGALNSTHESSSASSGSRRESRKRKRDDGETTDGCFFECNLCHDEFRRPQILCYHLYKHHQLPACCAYCNKHFFDTTQLMRHIKTAHVGRIEVDCWFCTSKPLGMRRFWDHLWRNHKRDMRRCRSCGQICFSEACLRAHQNLCVKLKMRALHDARDRRKVASYANKYKQPSGRSNNNRTQRYEGYDDDYQRTSNGDQVAPPVSRDMSSTPPYVNGAPSDGCLVWSVPPVVYPYPYPCQQPVGYPGIHVNPLLKDPRIAKKLAVEASGVNKTEGISDTTGQKITGANKPAASSTPISIPGVQTLESRIGKLPDDPNQFTYRSMLKNVKSFSPPPPPPPPPPNATSSKSSEYIPMMKVVARQPIKTTGGSVVRRELGTPGKKLPEPNLGEHKVLPCGCSADTLGHCCDVLKDLREELQTGEEKSSGSSSVVKIPDVAQASRPENAGKITPKPDEIPCPKLADKKKPAVPPPAEKRVKIKEETSAKILSSEKAFVDLTSPSKLQNRDKKTSKTVPPASLKSAKILSFSKVEQINSSKKRGGKIGNKSNESEKEKSREVSSSGKPNLTPNYRIPMKVPTVAASVVIKSEPSDNKKVVAKKEPVVPPKKRWASEFAQPAAPAPPQPQPPVAVVGSVATNEKQRPADRVETEYLCDLCEYRCLEKKSMEKHLVKKHFVCVAADRFVNYYRTYQVHKTVIDRETTAGGDRETHLNVKLDHLRKEVETLKQCLILMKPDMKR